jgi:hypothetical protein
MTLSRSVGPRRSNQDKLDEIDVPRNPVPTSTILRVEFMRLEEAAEAAAVDASRRESMAGGDLSVCCLLKGW